MKTQREIKEGLINKIEKMKNILGNKEDLRLYNKEGAIVYKFCTYSDVTSCEYTYDKNGKVLTGKGSDGYWFKFTYDNEGNELTYENSEVDKRGFEIQEFTMEELVTKLGDFKLIK